MLNQDCCSRVLLVNKKSFSYFALFSVFLFFSWLLRDASTNAKGYKIAVCVFFSERLNVITAPDYIFTGAFIITTTKKRTISDHLSVCYVYSETASFLFLLIFISLLVWWSCSCSHYEVAHCHYHDHYSFKAALVVMLYRGFFPRYIGKGCFER